MALRTPIGILSFPNLFVARAAVQGGEPRFSLNLIFDDAALKTPEYQALRAAVAEAIDAEWGAGKSKDTKFVQGLRLPFRKTSEKEYAGYDKGTIFVHAWSKQKPGVVDPQRQDILIADDVWAGQLARATVRPFAYQQSGNKGVSFALENVQIAKKDMPRLDGRQSANSAFDDLPTEGGSASAPVGDDAPF
jgi:hypothetical protein